MFRCYVESFLKYSVCIFVLYGPPRRGLCKMIYDMNCTIQDWTLPVGMVVVHANHFEELLVGYVFGFNYFVRFFCIEVGLRKCCILRRCGGPPNTHKALAVLERLTILGLGDFRRKVHEVCVIFDRVGAFLSCFESLPGFLCLANFDLASLTIRLVLDRTLFHKILRTSFVLTLSWFIRRRSLSRNPRC